MEQCTILLKSSYRRWVWNVLDPRTNSTSTAHPTGQAWPDCAKLRRKACRVLVWQETVDMGWDAPVLISACTLCNHYVCFICGTKIWHRQSCEACASRSKLCSHSRPYVPPPWSCCSFDAPWNMEEEKGPSTQGILPEKPFKGLKRLWLFQNHRTG